MTSATEVEEKEVPLMIFVGGGDLIELLLVRVLWVASMSPLALVLDPLRLNKPILMGGLIAKW